jgi:multicomponent Na+:H+ antiporter subunit E
MLLFLIFFWIILSGQIDYFHLFLGAFSVLLTVLFDKKYFSRNYLVLNVQSSWITFFFKTIKEIYISSIDVSRIIWSKDLNLDSVFKILKCSHLSELQKVIYANFITLTPGTMTVKIESNGDILIHAIKKSFLEDLEKSNNIKYIEKLIC